MRSPITRRTGHPPFLVVLGLGLTAGLSGLARPAHADLFSGSLAVTETYDSNILKYSPSDLDLLRTGSRPGKFAVRTPYDFRSALDVKLRWTPRLFRRNQTRVALDGGADFFALNPVANYQTVGLRVRQEFMRRNHVQAGLTYLPHRYLRNLWNVDSVRYLAAAYARRGLALELGREFSRRLALALGWRRALTDYNAPFGERSTVEDFVSAEVDWRFASRASLHAGYVHGRAVARGAGLGPTIQDVSDRSDQLDTGLDLEPGTVLGHPLAFALNLTYEHQAYTTAKVADRYHYHRQDNFLRGLGELSYRWNRQFTQRVRYTFEQNRTNLAPAIGTDVASYQDHRVSTGLTWSF